MRPEPGRRDSRSRSFVAGSVTLSMIILVVLSLAPASGGSAAGGSPAAEPFRWPEAHRVLLTVASPAPSATPGVLVVHCRPTLRSRRHRRRRCPPRPASLRAGAKPPTTPPTSKEPEDLKGYTWPLYQGRMTNFFGPRDNGFLVVDGQRIHPGLDTTTFCGDRVRAAHAGVVVAVGRRFAEEIGFGGPLDEFYRKIRHRHSLHMQPIVVVVDDGNGYRSMYVHLSLAAVKVGDKVRRRQAIGYEGRTGNANGCHVHYELVRMDGPWMRVAGELVKEYGYPAWERERVDPLRVLGSSMSSVPAGSCRASSGRSCPRASDRTVRRPRRLALPHRRTSWTTHSGPR